MKQHYVPEVYLRQWCDSDGHLIRYCRVGAPGAPNLRYEKKVPKGICWEDDLYSLPSGGIANGLSGDDIENLLARKVEQAILSIASAAGRHSGPIEPPLADQVKWLMQTFVARSPSALTALEADMVDWTAQHEPLIRRALATANTHEARQELSQYLDARFPPVAARAGLAGIVSLERVPMRGWYEGKVCLVHAAVVSSILSALGIDHFPTFDEPVVQWESNANGLLASLSISPSSVGLVLEPQATPRWQAVFSHVVSALRHRQLAICRTQVREGLWLSAAQELIPWTSQPTGR